LLVDGIELDLDDLPLAWLDRPQGVDYLEPSKERQEVHVELSRFTPLVGQHKLLHLSLSHRDFTEIDLVSVNFQTLLHSDGVHLEVNHLFVGVLLPFELEVTGEQPLVDLALVLEFEETASELR